MKRCIFHDWHYRIETHREKSGGRFAGLLFGSLFKECFFCKEREFVQCLGAIDECLGETREGSPTPPEVTWAEHYEIKAKTLRVVANEAERHAALIRRFTPAE